MNVILHWLTAPEWSQVVKTLLHSLWQGALIAAALVLIMRRLANPYARYRCSLVALAAIPVTGIITWAILNTTNHQPPLAPLPIATEAATPPNLIPLNQSPVTKLIVFTDHTPAPLPSHWTAWLALAWLIGAITMLGRAGVKVAGAEQLRRACQPLDHPQIAQLVTEARRAVGLARKIRVAVTDKLTSPAVVGVLVPTLILPLTLVTTLTPEQIRFILLHELAHIRRGDYFANLFQLFIEALLFFNPAVWWISHQVRREREACCDALAIELSGAPADYARTLVHVAENTLGATSTVAPAFGGERESSSLADRIQRLLVPGYRPALRLTWRAMLAAMCVGGTVLFLSAVGARNVVGAVSSNMTDTASKPATNVLGRGSSTADLNSDSISMPKWEGSRKRRFVESNVVGMGAFWMASEEETLARLEQIKFDKVFFRNRKLSEVLAELEKALLATDPDKQGFRLSLPPDWDYPAKRDGIESVEINMPAELRSATMRNVLDAIVSSASRPIRYGFGGFSANFTMKFDAPTNMWFQRFDMNRKIFLPFVGLEDSIPEHELSNSTATNSADRIGDAIRSRFLKAGVDLRPPNHVLYKPGPDLLYVYAPKEDVDKIEVLLTGIGQKSDKNSLNYRAVPDPFPNDGLSKWPVDGSSQLNDKWFWYRAGDGTKQTPALGITLTNGNSTVTIDPQNQVGMNTWTIDSKSNQNQQWYWYRIDKTNAPGLELTRPQPQITIKVRFVEIDMATVKNFGSLDVFLGTMPPGKSVAGKADEPAFLKSSSSNSVAGSLPSQPMGILSDPQYRVVLRAFEQREGAEVLALQEVTTANGGQAQMQTMEIKTIVTDINPKALVPPGITSTNKDGSGESLFITTNLPFGPVIKIVPAITPDGYNVALTVIPRMTEFLGYDSVEHPTNTVAVYVNGKKEKTTYPLPRLRIQQTTNNAVVRDGMTLVLGAPPVERTTRFKDKVPVLGDIPGVGKLFRSETAQVRTNALLIFITPTIVDPAGDRTSAPATKKSGADESFHTSSNLFPIIDRPIIY